MSCGYTETAGLSKFKCVNGVLKEFPTFMHMFSKNSPPITGRTVGNCPVCQGGSSVHVTVTCLEITARKYIEAYNGCPY